MKKDDTVYLRHVLDAVRKIGRYTEGVTYEQYLRNDMMQDGVVRQLEIIGEAVRSLSTDLRQAHPEVSWKQVVGMRNRLIHGYFEVDLAIVWEIVRVDLPSLRAQVADILHTLGAHNSHEYHESGEWHELGPR